MPNAMQAILKRGASWLGGCLLAASLLAPAHGQVITPTGTVTTIGGAFAGYMDGDNSVSQFNDPWGLTLGPDGRLFIADFSNHAVRILNPGNNVVSTFVSGGLLNGPRAITFHSSGDILVANYLGGNVLRYRTDGTFASVFASSVPGATALSVDFAGNIYVALEGGFVRKYSEQGILSSTYTVPASPSPSVQGVAVLADGSVVVSDRNNHVLWKFDADGGAPIVFAGGLGAAGFNNGTAGSARFNQPHQIAASTNNTVVVADRMNHRVRVVDFAGVVSTLYGADPSDWADIPEMFFPGWEDGDAATAWAREPVGIVAARDGTVFGSEVYFDIIRRAAGLAYPTNAGSGGGGGEPPVPGERNRISLGFENGEASSQFIGAPGQRFFVPIVLSILEGQRMYGLQFNFSVTNFPGSPLATGLSPGFASSLVAPTPQGFFRTIEAGLIDGFDPVVVRTTNIINGIEVVTISTILVPRFSSLVFPNALGNLVAVGWLERFGMTNLYNTRQQDLITFSLPHDTMFLSSGRRVVPGAASFVIPAAARPGHQYLLAAGRPSANSDGTAQDVVIEAPDVRDPRTGVLSAVRILQIGSPEYLVGDVAPFRWFNAGDFGDNTILNNDLEQLHQSMAYNLNNPPVGSDMANALDSCCRDINGAIIGDLSRINEIAFGDGALDMRDMIVSFRRALDGSLSNYVRFRDTTGALRARAITNNFRGTPGLPPTPPPPDVVFTENPAMAQLPSGARFYVESQRANPGQVARVPIRLAVTGRVPLRSMLVRLRVSELDGGVLAAPVAFSPNPDFGSPFLNASRGPLDRAVSWFNSLPDLPAGNYVVGTLSLSIPSNANADALFSIDIDRAEATQDLLQIPATSADGIVIMQTRAAAPWTDDIPDAWRVQHFGSLMNVLSAPDADADGDGMTTLQEYRAGTIPTDHGSRLALEGRSARTAFVLRWPTVNGKRYRLESSSTLTGGSWTVLEDQISGTGAAIERTPAVQDPAKRFYRVLVVE